MKNFSDYLIQLSGKIELPGELDDSKGYKLILTGEFPTTKEHNNQDGSWTKIFVFKPLTGEIEGEGLEITRLKDMRKKSQQLRAVLRREWQESGESIDEETYYEREMNEIISERINNR